MDRFPGRGPRRPRRVAAGRHTSTGQGLGTGPGIGVRSSYDEGTNEDAKRSLVQGINALDLALRGNVSSKRESAFSHFGYGLLIVRRLIQENRGLMIFVSGDDCVFLDRYKQRHIPLAKKWPGTFVGLVVELNNPLPLDEIYTEESELAAASGAAGRASAATSALASKEDEAPPVSEPAPEEEHYGVAAPVGAQGIASDYQQYPEVGIAIRAEIATILARDSSVRVQVTLDGITDITPSVADECFGKLAESLGFETFERRVILAGRPTADE